MGSWCNGQLVVWAYIMILLLSSLSFIWNNSFCQIPARYNSTASNIRNLPITPGLLYITHTTLCQQSSQLLVISLFSISNMLSWILRIILYSSTVKWDPFSCWPPLSRPPSPPPPPRIRRRAWLIIFYTFLQDLLVCGYSFVYNPECFSTWVMINTYQAFN